MARRATQNMPPDVEQELQERHLMDDYLARPHYQRNDYLGWISRAARDTTRAKRIGQMMDELERGGVYMNMRHEPSRKD